MTLEAKFLAIYSSEQLTISRSLHVDLLIVHLGTPGPMVELGDQLLTWTEIEFHGAGAFEIRRNGVRFMRYERGALEREHPFPDPPPSHTELRNQHTRIGLAPTRPPACPGCLNDANLCDCDTVVVDEPEAVGL
ncbi:MAG TPA: hypothetical protein VFZ21_25990 [Gemmatimonadaceae bacterium]|nr:hypothetical protein [Gemmatimonadaceae bacterium]